MPGIRFRVRGFGVLRKGHWDFFWFFPGFGPNPGLCAGLTPQKFIENTLNPWKRRGATDLDCPSNAGGAKNSSLCLKINKFKINKLLTTINNF